MGKSNILQSKTENYERVMKMMECRIIKDLFPSYIDGLTSRESNQMIEEHLEKCGECRTYLKAMKSELASERYTEINKIQANAEIRGFKKLRRKMFYAVIITAFTAAFLFGIYESYFNVGVSTLSGDVEITYENADGIVRIGFVPKKDNIYIGGGFGVTEPSIDGVKETFLLISYHVSPLKNRMDYQINMVNRMRQKALYLNYVFIDENTVLCVSESDEIVKLKGDEKLAVEYGDKTAVITLNDLRTEAGIKKLK